MKQKIRKISVAALFLIPTSQAFAWTFDGDVIFITWHAEAVTIMQADPFELTGMHVVAEIKEEGNLVADEDETCINGPTICSVEAVDMSLTQGCDYCGEGDAMPTTIFNIPNWLLSEEWGPICKTFSTPGR